ncbi:Listeria/Bacterioides repeat-containing protein [Butyrivibrio sp. INlla18]|uniref:InlB B-repeat-containing protein n=1 Tax=Butyrivibrio sp. INlla18 TaxID=1520806 RepID=UPI0008863533|nr:InlB B-repeat-containing protein [Butyrivibrio sp. INlla18]SDA49129.1 Listeria/Bacterioides repeat-containing protein [Butyrivibrio sp. INlla18]
MLRKWNRMLAFILAFALVTTTFSSDYASAKVYAVGDASELDENIDESGDDVQELEWDDIDNESDGDDNYDEPSDDDYDAPSDDESNDESDAASEGAGDEANTDATNNGETPLDETPSEGAEDAADAATSASTEEEAVAAASASSSEEVVVKEEVNMPAQSFYDSDGGLRVSVEAEEGAFPEETSMTVSAISDDEAMDAAIEALGEKVKQAKGINITFKDKDGNEIEPADAGKVHVTIKLNTELEGDVFSVVHKDDDGSAEKVAGASSDGGSFVADSFSVYIIASEDNEEELLRMVETYIFKVYNSETDSWEVVNEQSVKNGETLNNPGIPTLGENQEFFGWYIDGTENQPEFGLKNDITSTRDVIVKAKIQSTYYVTLIGVDEEVVQVLHKTVENDAEAKININVSVTPKKDTQAFVGWKNKADVTYDYGAEVDAKNENNRTLTAQVVDAYWIHFHENDGGTGGGASYTPPIFVTSKTNYKATQPKNPTRSGYEFTGWFLDSECEQAFDWSQSISSDQELYAGWRKGKASFTVVIWKQSIEDDRDATDAAKTYDYESSFVVSNYNAGAEITSSMLGNALTRTYEGFTYRTYDVENSDDKVGENEISPKGTTIVNVRYDRKLITYKFYTCSITQNGFDAGTVTNITEYADCKEMHGLYGQTIDKYGYTWPSTREWHEGKTVKHENRRYVLSGTGMTFLAEFSLKEDQDFYSNENETGSHYFRHYKQEADGINYPTNPTNTAKVEDNTTITFYFSNKYDGFTVDKYSTDGRNWSNIPASGTVQIYNEDLYIRYKRNSYKLTIASVLEPTDLATNQSNDTTPHVEKDDISVLYGASLSSQKSNSESFAKTVAAPVGYEAKKTDDGGILWADPMGAVPFNWNQAMPANNNTRAYIVWTKNRFVFNLDLNVDNDKNPDTTVGYDTVTISNGQRTSWKPYYGADGANKDAIMKNFTRDGYVLAGWFNYEDDNPYDYGKVTSNVNLYAKWRRVGGVNIVYDATPGTLDDENRDGATYAADSTVVVTSPAKPVTGFTFVGWQLLKSDDSVVATFYPNSSFVIDDSYIRTKTEDGETINYVLLKALYVETGTIDDIYTKVVYDANGGEGGSVTVTEVKGTDGTMHKIRVNEAITAWSAAEALSNGFKRNGWELIGWNIDKTAATQGEVKIALGKEYIIADNENNEGNPSTNTLYAVWKQKKATYIVKYYKGSVATANEIPSNIAPAQANVGDDVTLSNDIVQAYKPAKGYGDGSQVDAPYTMDVEQYDADGNVVPQVINVVYPPVKVTVTIKGSSDSKDYTGEEQSVTGYEVVSISDTSYTEDDFDLAEGVEAKVSGTDAGTYKMNLDSDSFVNTNTDFTDVTFVVTDGQLVIKKITTKVTIKGDVKTNDYDGQEHVAKGYTVTSTNPKFKASDVEFTPIGDLVLDGTEPVAKRTDAGKTSMGLTVDMFKSTNDNFENVTFEVQDGSQTIKKISAKVTIVGNNNTTTYDGEEHKVTGYEVTSISNSLYTVNDFDFTPADNMNVDDDGNPVAARTEVGSTPMGLAKEQFSNKSGNFENVEFDVTDGYQAITAADKVTVTITGNSDTSDYDGEEHSVSGYAVNISNPLYTENDFDFVPAVGMELDNNGKPVAKGTDAGTYNMGLAVGQFVNNSDNFEEVEFIVLDGYQEITPISVTVTITGENDETDYDGEEHSVSGYSVEISNSLYTEEDFTFTPASDMEIEEGEPVAKGTDAGTYNMGLAVAQFKNSNNNFKDVEFEVHDGYQTINPISVTVTITGAIENAKYDGKEHVATGYSFSPSTALYTEEDFTYTAEEGMTLVGGEPAAKRTEAGKTFIGLKPGQFANANTKNFSSVEFDVTDGYVYITKADKVTVTITGHTDEFDYNGEKRTVSGFDKKADSELFDLTKVEFDGTASVSETDAGTYPMGLTEDMFSATDDNFAEIAFEIVDGELKIKKITTTVTITGNHDSTPYDGEEHSVTGYTAEADSSLYDAKEDVAYTGTDEPSAERTDAGKTPMGLTADDFENTNENFENVTFVIVDGYQEITKINATVKIKGTQDSVTFDNADHTVTGYEVTSISTDLYTEDDFKFVQAGDVKVNEDGEPIATRKFVGTTDMKLTSENFENTSGNFDEVTFEVTDGYQEIVPVGEVKVKIFGKQDTTDYDGEEHSVWGYTYETSSELYTDEDFKFTPGAGVVLDQDGRPTATQTDAGTAYMGLDEGMFENTNENFDKVTFEVEDGYQEITPISATVTIVGNKKTLAYNGKEQKVEGYKVTNISTNLYTEEDFTFSGPKNVKRTDVGSTSMGLLEEHFVNKNSNFDNVKFEITDGEITISPLAIKVSIIGNKDKKEFNGSEQNITGYKATFNDTVVASPEGNSAETYTLTADAVENIYKEEYIVFDYNGDGVADTKNDAIAKGTVKGEYPMNLDKEQFTNSNENFEVEFEVEDGLLEIINREKPYSLVLKSDDVHTPYNGMRQSYTILAGVGVEDSENPVQATINAILNKIASFFGITASAEDGDVTFTCEGVEYVLKGAKVNAFGTEVGEYAFEFIGEPEVMLGEEPVTKNFDIKYELGKLVIDKAEVTITVNSFTKAQNTADPQFTGVITGLQGDDTLDLGYGRVGGEAPGTYAITPNMTKEELEMEYTNYTFTIIPGVLTITGGGGGDEPGDPTPIPDDPTPAAPTPTPAPAQAVLGARREEPVNGQAVLGARRARTEDTTDNTSRVFAIVIAAAVVASLVFTKKRKEEQE